MLAKRIGDKRTLKLIRSYLNSGIMEGGLVSARTEGTPQGSPLSPDPVQYRAGRTGQGTGRTGVIALCDMRMIVSLYVGSEKAAQRVKESITEYIEKKLKLRVNREKTQVSQAQQSNLLRIFLLPKQGAMGDQNSP